MVKKPAKNPGLKSVEMIYAHVAAVKNTKSAV